MFTPVKNFSGKDREQLIIFYNCLIEILETGESEIDYAKKDIHYLHSLKARLEDGSYKKKMDRIIKLLKSGELDGVGFTEKDVNFLKYITDIIYNNVY